MRLEAAYSPTSNQTSNLQCPEFYPSFDHGKRSKLMSFRVSKPSDFRQALWLTRCGLLLLLGVIGLNTGTARAQVDSSRRFAQAVQTTVQTEQVRGREIESPAPISGQQIERALQDVDAANLDEETKSAIVAHYQNAKQFLMDAEFAAGEAAKFRLQSDQAASTIAEAREALASTESKSTLMFDDKTPTTSSTSNDSNVLPPMDALQNLARQKADRLAELEGERIKLVELPGKRQARLLAIPDLEFENEKRQTEIRRQLNLDAPANEIPLMTSARLAELNAELEKASKQLQWFRFERKAYEATPNLPTLKLDFKAKQIDLILEEISIIDRAIAKRRVSEFQELAKEKSVPTQLQPLADENRVLAAKLIEKNSRLAEVKKIGQAAQAEQRKTESDFKRAETRVEAIGLSGVLGKMLRRYKTEILAKRRRYLSTLSTSGLASEEEQSQIDKISWEDQLSELSDIESAVDRSLLRLDVSNPELRAPAKELLEQRQEILGELEELETEFLLDMLEVKTAHTQFLSVSKDYVDFIDQHVLWVRSLPVIGQPDPQGVSESQANVNALGWMTSGSNWRLVGESIVRSAKERLPSAALVLSGLLGLFLVQPRVRSELKNSGELASKRGCRNFSPTLSAIMQTCLLAMNWPAIGLTLGWLLQTDSASQLFPQAIGRGLTVVSLVAIPFEIFRWTCRDNGLAHLHFDWTETFRRTLKKHLGWLIPAAAPLLFVVVAIEFSDQESWHRLGRIAMIVLLILSAIFFYQVFRPNSPVFSTTTPNQEKGYFYRLRYFRHISIMLVHMMLILFAVLGYYYSVYVIGNSLLQTATLAIAGVILFAIAMRFLLVRRRNLRYEQLIQQRTQARAAAEQLAQTGNAPASPVESLDIELQYESGLDITNVSRQARELTYVIFWIVIGLVFIGVWQYLLPATKILDGWELWRVTIGSSVEAVTARDLLISLVAFAITFFGVRNMPGMLELLLLQRLPLDSGARYAVTSIFRYILLVAGVIIALSFLKIPWSKYSWLVAAISVGLGFGLQEIVANFVSGLILLLERPVRVGDVVTIDGVTGVVSRIQMRATTVTNWDNQELVVPNKDLISGKLLNWTLSSVVNRLAFKFGVAYGTDVEKVREIALKIIDENAGVLKEPKPFVTFEEFGDSSLNFTIRCCTSAIEKRWVLINDINTALNKELTAAGIEIPFPQREVRILENS